MAAAGVVAAVVVSIVAVSLSFPGPRPPLTGASVSPSASPAGTAGPTATPTAGPTATPEPWGPLAVEPFVPVADLAPTSRDTSGVALDAGFVLASRGDEPATELAGRLAVSPDIALSVAAGPDPRSVTLWPDAPLTPGLVYRFRLAAPDDSLAGSWAFQAKRPLHVVGTLPSHQYTDVPLDTGIEITFDQDGVRDAASHFSIEPAVEGRFEQHGRVLVFVPRALEPRTIYTVTVRRGVSLTGSDQVLEEDVRFQFETAARSEGERWLRFFRQVMEWETGSAPVVPLSTSEPGLASLPVDVYRFDTLSDFRAALELVGAAPAWTQWAGSAGLVPTDDLTRVAHLDATLEPLDTGDEDARLLRLPRLHRGWYLVEATLGERPQQLFLQVTDVATYAAVTWTRTVFWVNDLATGGPLAGAEVISRGGTVLGRTDRDGLLVVDSAAVLGGSPTEWDAFERTPGPSVVVRAADGRAALIHLGESYWGLGCGGPSIPSPADPYWHLLYTERSLFRSTDTVNAWGLVRARADGTVPTGLELRLVETSQAGSPPIAVAPLEARDSGAFAASVEIREAPPGGYRLELWAGGEVIADRWLTVGPIVKPAYRLELSTDRHVYVAGDPAEIVVGASFYEGTAVPGVGVEVGGFGESAATTRPDGTATVRGTAALDPSLEGWEWVRLSARPSGAEEGEIGGATTVLVFPSARTIEAEGRVAGGELTVTGAVHAVDLGRLERDFDRAMEWDLDPRGAPSPGLPVAARVTELTWEAKQIGTRYEFIEKRVEPIYEYTEKTRDLGARQAVTGADGSFTFSLPVEAGDHGYRIVLTASDPQGRQARRTIGASTEAYSAEPARGVYLESALLPDGAPVTYALGDTARVTMRDDAGPLPEGGADRYLFLEAQRGLRDAAVQRSPTYAKRFEADDLPNTTVWAAHFDGRVYEAIRWGAAVPFDRSTRALQVTLSADAARYAPGDRVTLEVTTRRADGAPTSATVTLGAVDEKLFALGAIEVIDPLGDLYAALPSGVLRTYASHRNERIWPPGCGPDVGGGRQDFRDEILFRQVTTDATGRARVTFELSDDLTSWYVTAAAVTGTPEAGLGTLLVPVGLSFFVDATLAADYLAGERPVLRLRTYGDALRPGDEVRFEVSAETLGLGRTTVTGRAFEAVEVELPALPVGRHRIDVTAGAGSGPGALSDRLIRTFTVAETRLVSGRTEYSTLTPGFRPAGGPGLTTYTFSDAGRGSFQPFLQGLLWSGSARLDRSLAAEQARLLLAETFGEEAAAVAPPPTFSPERYETGDGGIALLPHASPDLELSAWVALTAPHRFDRGPLRNYFELVRSDPETTRERVIIALTGLIALGAPLLGDVQALFALPDLTIRERLWIALAAEAVGDDGTALVIERALLAAHGQRFGPWIRLRVGESLDDTLEATAMLAVVAAGLGDPLAAQADAYVGSNRAKDLVFDLQRLAYAQRAIERTPAAPASFAYTVDGARRVVELGPGESFSLALTPSQRATLSLERLAGDVGVATAWQQPFDPASVEVDPSLRIERTVSPSGVIPAAGLVTVTLRVTFDRQAPRDACYQVTDFAPSGLAPTLFPAGGGGSYAEPYSVVGQRVDFCIDPARPLPARYVARVVSPGTYSWEPAIVQSTVAAESLALTPATTITIR